MVLWKTLFSKWTAVWEEKTYYLTNLVFSEKKMNFYYSVPTWETLGPMLSKVAVIKFGNPSWLDTWTFWHLVILCCMPLDVVRDYLKHAKKCFVTNPEHSWAIYMYIQSIVSNYFLNTLRQTSNIYLKWSLQLMLFFWFFHQ